MRERGDLVGLLGLYALYRRLCPTNMQPDPKLYRRLWTLQKEAGPLLVLHARAVFSPPDFLQKYAAFDVKRLDPPDVDGTAMSYQIPEVSHAFVMTVRKKRM